MVCLKLTCFFALDNIMKFVPSSHTEDWLVIALDWSNLGIWNTSSDSRIFVAFTSINDQTKDEPLLFLGIAQKTVMCQTVLYLGLSRWYPWYHGLIATRNGTPD